MSEICLGHIIDNRRIHDSVTFFFSRQRVIYVTGLVLLLSVGIALSTIGQRIANNWQIGPAPNLPGPLDGMLVTCGSSNRGQVHVLALLLLHRDAQPEAQPAPPWYRDCAHP